MAVLKGGVQVLRRVWFFITESDPPEKPKAGIRIFSRAKPRAPRATSEPPITER
ncbi:hypothetical protein GCM10017655_24290 [Pseudomonas turukhanskensis]|uniref:Uncharacterized protein n=2 Tax=Pseudomonas turukhanskensis TaxID=1806536 RepID=A0A9W6NG07_9PSED|nr:hypothetical protein GCM10017655_24290 [Pseudomonas turukhanskensis]